MGFLLVQFETFTCGGLLLKQKHEDTYIFLAPLVRTMQFSSRGTTTTRNICDAVFDDHMDLFSAGLSHNHETAVLDSSRIKMQSIERIVLVSGSLIWRCSQTSSRIYYIGTFIILLCFTSWAAPTSAKLDCIESINRLEWLPSSRDCCIES